jgi:hypothetical protein
MRWARLYASSRECSEYTADGERTSYPAVAARGTNVFAKAFHARVSSADWSDSQVTIGRRMKMQTRRQLDLDQTDN